MKGEITDVYMHLGKEKLDLGDYQGAIADFTEAIHLNPDDAHVYYYRGNAKFELGDEQGANDDYEQMARLLQQQGVLEVYEELNP